MNNSKKFRKVLGIFEYISAILMVGYCVAFYFLLSVDTISGEDAGKTFAAFIIMILTLPLFLVAIYPVSAVDSVWQILYGSLLFFRIDKKKAVPGVIYILMLIFRIISSACFLFGVIALMGITSAVKLRYSFLFFIGIAVIFTINIAMFVLEIIEHKKAKKQEQQ